MDDAPRGNLVERYKTKIQVGGTQAEAAESDLICEKVALYKPPHTHLFHHALTYTHTSPPL